ncbi:hypothetical protein RRG08_017198 [Elysia crispata]|uniref:Uncharacterized protein n=1 Tax=Elysia crispata TaxID=231223 RepID=A0AAE0XUT3_9GAST|nr:hypothetical protein RRG08_017198 [Elysia crispata]
MDLCTLDRISLDCCWNLALNELLVIRSFSRDVNVQVRHERLAPVRPYTFSDYPLSTHPSTDVARRLWLAPVTLPLTILSPLIPPQMCKYKRDDYGWHLCASISTTITAGICNTATDYFIPTHPTTDVARRLWLAPVTLPLTILSPPIPPQMCKYKYDYYGWHL